MGLFPFIITTRMIINVRWGFNIATRNCFCEHIIPANHLLLDTNSKSRAGIILNNWIYFVGQNQKKGFACLCLTTSVLHDSKASCGCLWGWKGHGWVQKFTREGLGTQENLRLTLLWVLPSRAALTKAHSALLSSALNTQNMHIGKGGGQSHPRQGLGRFFLLFGHTEASFFPSGQQRFSAQSCSAQTICWAWNSTQGQLAFSWVLKSCLKRLHLEFLQFLWQAKLK